MAEVAPSAPRGAPDALSFALGAEVETSVRRMLEAACAAGRVEDPLVAAAIRCAARLEQATWLSPAERDRIDGLRRVRGDSDDVVRPLGAVDRDARGGER